MDYTYVFIFISTVLIIYYSYTNFFYNIHDKSNIKPLCLPSFNLEENKKLAKNYKVKIYNNFLTHDECDFFINYAKNKLKRSQVNRNNSDVLSNYRTSKNTWIYLEYNKITKKISKRVSKITNLPCLNQEDMQILKYDIGDYYKCHYDNTTEEDDDTITSGPRIYTFFIYLNDVEKGGETSFPLVNLKYKPKKGTAILFKNMLDNHIHPCSLHEGVAPISGEKWAMNIWVREKNYQPKNSIKRLFKKIFFRTGLFFDFF